MFKTLTLAIALATAAAAAAPAHAMLTINAIEAGGALNGRVVAIELPPQTDQAH